MEVIGFSSDEYIRFSTFYFMHFDNIYIEYSPNKNEVRVRFIFLTVVYI